MINRRNKKIGIYLIFVISVFLVSQTGLSIYSAIKGAQLSSLESEKNKLSTEYQDLNSEVISLQSLSRIDALAQQSGLSKPQNVIYLKNSDTLAGR